ncbi:MAG: DUF2029 domain-containing protein [Acidobacteriota bacterium]|nr:DUF2029 domain-containing protein [Acidobacteriota bacterium]
MRVTRPGLHVWIVGLIALYFFVSGVRGASRESTDFIPVYSGVRCLLHGCNPYSIPDLNQQFLGSGGRENDLRQAGGWQNESPLYPPSTLVTLLPLGLLPFPAAKIAWSLLSGGLFIVAVWLVLSLCRPPHQWLTTLLAALFLLINGQIVRLGQPSGFAISLLAISVALFMRRGSPLLAACLLALSLAVKPQIGGLIAVYLLAHKAHRRYAGLAVAAALGLFLLGALILHMRPGSAHWVADLRTSITASMQPGQVNAPDAPDVGVANLAGITSPVFAGRRRANLIAIGIFLLLAAAWAVGAARDTEDPEAAILALGALSALSLLPVYHRQYDSALLLLSMPSLLVILERRRVLGAIIACLTFPAGALFPGILGEFLWTHAPAVRQSLLDNKFSMFLVISSADDLPSRFRDLLTNKFFFVLLLRQQNLVLLLVACLYIVAMYTARSPHGLPQP